MNKKLSIVIPLLLSIAGSGVWAQQDSPNWTRLRGPNGTGLALNADLPIKELDGQILWKTKLAGEGSSSPVVWGKLAFVCSANPKTAKLTIQALDVATGKEVWAKSYESLPYRIHRSNSFATSTPTVDEQHVYVTFANPKHTFLIALDHQGNEKWKRDFGTFVGRHGFGGSPIRYKDKVVFFNSQQADRLSSGEKPGISRMIAVNAATGKDVWETRLKTTSVCYSVPCILAIAGQPDQIVGCNTGNGFFGLDPEKGKLNWSADVFKMRTVASPYVAKGLLLGSNGSGGGGNYVAAIKPPYQGSPAKNIYEMRKGGSYVPATIAVGDLLFMFSDKGITTCADLRTGKTHWQERGVGKSFSGSPVATRSHVYIMDEAGYAIVLRASNKFKVEHKTHLGEPTRSTPAIADNRIYFRTLTHLVCVGKKTEKADATK